MAKLTKCTFLPLPGCTFCPKMSKMTVSDLKMVKNGVFFFKIETPPLLCALNLWISSKSDKNAPYRAPPRARHSYIRTRNNSTVGKSGEKCRLRVPARHEWWIVWSLSRVAGQNHQNGGFTSKWRYLPPKEVEVPAGGVVWCPVSVCVRAVLPNTGRIYTSQCKNR